MQPPTSYLQPPTSNVLRLTSYVLPTSNVLRLTSFLRPTSFILFFGLGVRILEAALERSGVGLKKCFGILLSGIA
jgi:hypothetical protein